MLIGNSIGILSGHVQLNVVFANNDGLADRAVPKRLDFQFVTAG
jgi:hypothetical protein